MSRERVMQIGDRLDGRFELLRPCGEGRMATVWLARVQGTHGFEKLYAVKTIRPHLAADATLRTMFLDEARIASRIRHSNVAELEYFGEEDGHLYMVLEWIPGGPWSKLVAAIGELGDPIPVDVMLRIAADACAGLHAAHELKDEHDHSLNVVHRDVSPDNVMITDTGVVKIIDFGVAKAKGRASAETRNGIIKGRLDYLAPEVALGKPVDRRADVWAIGATLYHALAGRPPFPGKTDIEVLRRIGAGKPMPLPTRVPRPVSEAVMRALTPDLRQRVSTALEFQRQLESVMESPVSPGDVARTVGRYLERDARARQEAIAGALEEARVRATAHPPSRPAPPVAEPPPTSVPTRLVERASATEPESIRSVRRTERRWRPAQIAWATMATLVALGVWCAVLLVAIHSHDRLRHRSLTPGSETGDPYARL